MIAAATASVRAPWPRPSAIDLIAARLVLRRRRPQPAPSTSLTFGFRKALRLLDSSEWTARLEGVRGLTALADNDRELRQQAIDALCGYLREPRHCGDVKAGHEGRLRATIIRLIAARLQWEGNGSWRGHDFDFSGVVFENGSFANACFTGGRVSFAGARFAGEIDFTNTIFSSKVDFSCAQFISGKVNFTSTTVTGGSLDFSGAQFQGGIVDFYGAHLMGGQLLFTNATLSAGTLDFYAARFRGSSVTFAGAHFGGAAVRFASALFAEGAVTFQRAIFAGGQVDFTLAHFNGTRVCLRNVYLIGGVVDLSRPFSNLKPPATDKACHPALRLPEKRSRKTA